MKQTLSIAIVASAVIGAAGCQDIESRLTAREGYRAYDKGEYAEAVNYYHAALTANPTDLGLVRNLAYAHLAAAKAAKVFDDRARHLRAAIELLLPLARHSPDDATVAMQAAASTVEWLRLTRESNVDQIRAMTTDAYEAALGADAAGTSGALSYAVTLLRERARMQENVMDARADLDHANELEQMANVRNGVGTVDLVSIATP